MYLKASSNYVLLFRAICSGWIYVVQRSDFPQWVADESLCYQLNIHPIFTRFVWVFIDFWGISNINAAIKEGYISIY